MANKGTPNKGNFLLRALPVLPPVFIILIDALVLPEVAGPVFHVALSGTVRFILKTKPRVCLF